MTLYGFTVLYVQDYFLARCSDLLKNTQNYNFCTFKFNKWGIMC